MHNWFKTTFIFSFSHFSISLLCFVTIAVNAQETPNSRQAKRMFLDTYHRAFSEEGATMHYKVNIASLYKTDLLPKTVLGGTMVLQPIIPRRRKRL